MARKVQILMVDDLDGKELPDGEAQTVKFSLDNSDYEIDLSQKNADALRKVMGKYTEAARRVARAGKTSSGRRVQHTGLVDAGTGVNPKEVRAWAVDKGLMSADSRGRIPTEIVTKYKEEHAA